MRNVIRGVRCQVGSIVVKEYLGNMLIYKSHTPSEQIVIERADIDDLMVALAACLGVRNETKENVKPGDS